MPREIRNNEESIKRFHREIDLANKDSVFKLVINTKWLKTRTPEYNRQVVYRTKSGLKNAIRHLLDPMYPDSVRNTIKLFIYLTPDKIIE